MIATLKQWIERTLQTARNVFSRSSKDGAGVH
jgi:hypothetical protein